VFVLQFSLAAVVTEVMPPVTTAADTLKENLGQELVFCDGIPQGFDVGFFC
jgi:hypothetical protein